MDSPSCSFSHELHFNICKQIVGAHCYHLVNAILLTVHVCQVRAYFERKNLAWNQAWICLSNCGRSLYSPSVQQKTKLAAFSGLKLFKGFSKMCLISAPLYLTLMWLSYVTVEILNRSVQWNCFHLSLCYLCLTQLVTVRHQKLIDCETYCLYFCINTTESFVMIHWSVITTFSFSWEMDGRFLRA